jgi:hypothetical protein
LGRQNQQFWQRNRLVRTSDPIEKVKNLFPPKLVNFGTATPCPLMEPLAEEKWFFAPSLVRIVSGDKNINMLSQK